MQLLRAIDMNCDRYKRDRERVRERERKAEQRRESSNEIANSDTLF